MRILPFLRRRREPVGSKPAPPLRLAFRDEAADRGRRVLVTLLGVPADAAAGLIEAALKGAGRETVTIFVTSSLDFEPFRRHGTLFEYLPPPASLGLDDPIAAEDYVREKMQLIRAKWCAAAETTLGRSLESFLNDGASGAGRTS